MVENKQVVEYRLEGWNGAQQLVKPRYFRATRPIFLTSLLPQACANTIASLIASRPSRILIQKFEIILKSYLNFAFPSFSN
jgi:hypothetical protein